MSTSPIGRPRGSSRSALERARQSLTRRRNYCDDLVYKHEKERRSVLRAILEAEALVARLEAEGSEARDES
jgi:transposase